jgi:hypothetical protein
MIVLGDTSFADITMIASFWFFFYAFETDFFCFIDINIDILFLLDFWGAK